MGLTKGKPAINSLVLKSMNCDLKLNNKLSYNRKINIDKQLNFFLKHIRNK